VSDKRPALPAYIRLPDGLRVSGTTRLTADSRLVFIPKQAISILPPEGLPVQLTVAGLPDDEEGQVSLSTDIEKADPRELVLQPEEDPPEELIAALAPDSVVWLPPQEEADALLARIHEEGLDTLQNGLRRFLVDLGDHLFDLSTSSQHGISGQHCYYDALNALKRGSDEFIEEFTASVRDSLRELEKDTSGQTFADLEEASARSLDLVAFDEMDQKLAVDKIINRQIEQNRIELECLTIRAALVADLEPRRARTPFHPAFIVQAFVKAFQRVSDDTRVLISSLNYFRDEYLPLLDKLYPTLNGLLKEAGIEPGLEEDIRENGSLLNPVQKRIIKSTVRSHSDDQRRNTPEAPAEPYPASDDDRPAPYPGSKHAGDGAPPSRDREAPATARDSAPERRAPRDKHDAMYDAVVSALDTSRGDLPRRDSGRQAEGDFSGPDGTGPSRGGTSVAGTGARGDITVADGGAADSGAMISEQRLTALLKALQTKEHTEDSLAGLRPLAEEVREAAGDDGAVLDRDGANRLGFIDNVFQTLHRNFEVSADMAPSLARLRVPLARLSLAEPRFFAQPDHPAHQLLDKLSMLAGADRSATRAVQTKVAAIVDRIVEDYDGDSEVFAGAQRELDKLLAQQGRVLERNVERVVKGLEGQERLSQAQRRVENLVRQHVGGDRAPRPLLELLDGGWRSALVQLALREGEDSDAWREEAALLGQLTDYLRRSDSGNLSERAQNDMQQRLRALNKRLSQSNPGSVSHEDALGQLAGVLSGQLPLATAAYVPPSAAGGMPEAARVEKLPRLRRWLERVRALEPGARLRYNDRDGKRRRMRLVWVSEDRDRFAFVNERGQKVAELTAVQLARQLSRGAAPPTRVDEMSVLQQSMYATLEQAQKTLSFERNSDRVTHLINGESLLYQLRRSLRHAQAHDSEHAFLVLDIDNFALVNDVFDTTSGDEVLGEFAKLLGQLNDSRALTARLEEDEFGILLAYRQLADARRIADKIRSDIASSSLELEDESVSFTVSMGIAPIQRITRSPEQVLEQARSALRIAKDQGRDQVVVYDVDQNEMHRYQQERASSRRQLEEAMDTDTLVLRAQPIVQTAVDGSEGASHHYEILLSLRDEKGELQSPQDFIRSAERFGFVTLVDRWVVAQAFAWMSELVDKQKQVPQLSINLSGTSITDNEFLEYVLEQISEYGVGTSRLCFEITETGAIDNLPRAADFVRTLRNIGCAFSLDDFGTGLASHKYLKELPVDYVKIDGTFISSIHNSDTDYAMAKSINDLAHFLGQRTIAECVESLEVVPSLREIGIDFLQGWGVGMPRPLSEIIDELPDLET
jgi:diguanylate cyclase (GGDEF)-like protein